MTDDFGADFSAALIGAYKGEVFGEAMFMALARLEDSPDRRDQLAALALLEEQTKETLAAFIAEVALPVPDGFRLIRGG